jgi:hypothetical protein
MATNTNKMKKTRVEVYEQNLTPEGIARIKKNYSPEDAEKIISDYRELLKRAKQSIKNDRRGSNRGRSKPYPDSRSKP